MPPAVARLRGLARSALIAAVLACNAAVAHAAPLSFSVLDRDRVGRPGTDFVFAGSGTNDTGALVRSTDLFFDFGGYDPVAITPVQLLGTTDVAIPDGTTSALLDLFLVRLEAWATPRQTYFVDAILQDVQGSLSDTVTVSIRALPEPASATLALLALLAVVRSRRAQRGDGRSS